LAQSLCYPFSPLMFLFSPLTLLFSLLPFLLNDLIAPKQKIS
jgi:hypothetical protein